MDRTLALMRHGLATGQAPDAPLMAEGEDDVRRLGARLAAEGWRPGVVLCSPYRRAAHTAQLMAEALAPSAGLETLRELVPEGDPAEAVAVVRALAADHACVLVVSHLPLVALLTAEFTGDTVAFTPGTWVELALPGHGRARLVRRVAPREPGSPV
ncbi:MAG: phosphohistidine phosphatase SixA [bacterium]